MKLLFSSSDPGKLELMLRELNGASIGTETRHVSGGDDGSGIPVYPELWIKREEDYEKACLIFARRGTAG